MSKRHFEVGGLLVLDAVGCLEAADIALQGGWRCRAYKPWTSVTDRNGEVQKVCRVCPGFGKCSWTVGMEGEGETAAGVTNKIRRLPYGYLG